jgi:CRISPR-associated protein Cas2
MKGYGEPWQYSVFFCSLKDIDRVRLQSELEREMNLKEDQVIIVDLGVDEKHAREAACVIGQTLPPTDNTMVVI